MHGPGSQSGYIHQSFVDPGYAGYSSQQLGPYGPNAGASAVIGSDGGLHFAGPTSHGNALPGYPGYANSQGYSQAQMFYPSYPTHSKDGRPFHTVIAFGFGGSFAVIRSNPEAFFSSEQPSSTIEVASLKSLIKSPGLNLAGGVEKKSKDELFRWVDERCASCISEETDPRIHKSMPLLWEALKIAYDHHGMMRPGLQHEENGPGAAMGVMILSANPNLDERCLKDIPGAGSIQATHMKVKGYLLSGKTRQALECATEGHSWGLALMLAKEIGYKCFADTVATMAYKQLVPGVLRAFNLLSIEKSAEEVFPEHSHELVSHWHEYLALVATNRSFADDAAVARLGDMLWRFKQDAAAAHLCYLLLDQAQTLFEAKGGYRLRLIGADHVMYPRTFATPLAIMRTELYEHVKSRENPQFVLEAFQPYKLIYAAMLAEDGQKLEALRYTRAFLRALKSMRSSREVNVEACSQAASDLEIRLIHSLEDKNSYGSIAGRMLSNTFSYVTSSLPGPRMTRNRSMPEAQTENSGNNSPLRSISLPDLTGKKAQDPGFLRRVGSSVVQTITRSKKADESSVLDRENPIMYSTVVEDELYIEPQPQALKKPSTGLYGQCSEYYSRCVNSFVGEGSLVKSLMSPQLPSLFKRKPEPQRVLEV